ncbi:Purine permease [Quillaja saponaria]|uniref:Probable purine permease n=1 Tax=Quillaja saponaria TaxID=32244 RepID=A0AAD7KWU9_QUISA|nr:Purine permease [Quillaja saponaria]
MGETQEVQLQIMAQGAKEAKSLDHSNSNIQSKVRPRKNYKRWLRIALYTLFLLFGQSIATLLGRLYYDKGGKSKWMGTLVNLVGFPILLPYYCISAPKNPTRDNIQTEPPSASKLAFVYVSLGLLVVLDCYLYSVGLLYLTVSTYSLICASQLGFNAFFSYFLNSQKFTPFIINSLVLLTISSTLLVFQSDSSAPTGVSKGKYAIGFICTVAASAGYGLVLSLTQLAFRKVLKKETFKVIMDMIIYQSLVATTAAIVGLFASGEWKGIKSEMEVFELGKTSYILTLSWTAITWQLFGIGCTGLIFEVSALFSNAISVLGLPIVPVLAVIFFHDQMHGIKVISMLLAIWGFVSYAYQHYLEEFKSKTESRNMNDVSKGLQPEEVK